MSRLLPEQIAPPFPPATDATGPLVVTTYVYGTYQDYIPLYVFTVLRAYPDYFVKIFLRERLQPRNRGLLDQIRTDLSDRFEVVEAYLADLDGFTLSAGRWVISRSDLAGFDYAYIGDVDFIICRESPDLRAMHVGYCRDQHLPYSNSLRYKTPPVRKLSGLHFIETTPYFEAMEPVIQEARQAIRNGRDGQFYRRNNELILYDLVDQGIGRFPPRSFRPNHGLHLGQIRARPDLDIARDVGGVASYYQSELAPDPRFQRLVRGLAPGVRSQVRRAERAMSGGGWLSRLRSRWAS